MHKTRIALVGLVALCLAPGTFVRSTVQPVRDADYAPPVAVRLAVEPAHFGPFTLVGAWDIQSDDPRVGGYSALALTAPDQLTAISDAGRVLRIDLKDGAPANLGTFSPPKIQRTVDGTFFDAKQNWDVELLTRDPETGTLWAGFEGTNAIERLTADLESETVARPAEMRDWSGNSGPEALARLPDGRFIVLEEGRSAWLGGARRGVLFDGDPVEGAKATRFSLAGLDGFAPVDAIATADGRVLVLLRKITLGVLPPFASAIMVLDPADIAEGRAVTGIMLANLPTTVPYDNFEGIALSTEADGHTYLWLIADDNLMQIQRSLLLKLHLQPSTIAP